MRGSLSAECWHSGASYFPACGMDSATVRPSPDNMPLEQVAVRTSRAGGGVEMSGLRKRMKKRPDGGAPAGPEMLALSTEGGFTAHSYKTQGGGRSTRERTPAD